MTEIMSTAGIEKFKLAECWAKTHPDTGLPALTVRDHSLAVGAVAALAAERLPGSCRHLLPEGGVTLTAAHDIGKITPGFQTKCAFSRACAFPGASTTEKSHTKVGQSYLASLPEMATEEGTLQWPLVADGHHGSYSTPRARNLSGLRSGGLSEGPWSWPSDLRAELLAELVRAFGALPREKTAASAGLHWMTGFTTFCDWIGSNTDWFPLPDDGILKDRWTLPEARRMGEEALDRIGWHRRETRSGLDFPGLFGEGMKPRPLQTALMDLADERGLYIVEAPMGAGKTEAALGAAYRRWQDGGERGLYFALPTQLTSNRIHRRICDFLNAAAADETVSALAHGNAWLREDRIQAFSPAGLAGDISGTMEMCQWFSSSRRALLAPFGTGTIDQALMARLAVKHSALRLFALAGKVVVVDEVHSYDPYASRLLDRLVSWLLETGCSVIVLSATLTAARRAELVSAAGAVEPQPVPQSYPLITKVVAGRASHHPVEDVSLSQKRVTLRHCSGEEEAMLEEAVAAAENGACVLLIRNTVDRAKESFRRAKNLATEGEMRIGLLHSRFPQFQRDANEEEWMEMLGRSGGNRPKGCLLVATQVVEQSVDLDADLLITDLAPTDLLLQRIGRLHRHERKRPAGYENPVCWIEYPVVDWNLPAKELVRGLGPAGKVYPPGTLWRSEQVWRTLDSLMLPGSIRGLLEQTHGAKPAPPPGVAELNEELRLKTENQQACVDRRNPFRCPDVDDIEGCQTRWISQETALLTLLAAPPQVQAGRVTLHPLNGNPVTFPAGRFDYRAAVALHCNAVRAPLYILKEFLGGMPDWLAPLLPNGAAAVVDPASTELAPLGERRGKFLLNHHPAEGLGWNRSGSDSKTMLHEDDFDCWY